MARAANWLLSHFKDDINTLPMSEMEINNDYCGNGKTAP